MSELDLELGKNWPGSGWRMGGKIIQTKGVMRT